MIDVYTNRTLAQDATLQALLGGTAEESKIAPRATGLDAPCVVYMIEPSSCAHHINRCRIVLRVIDRDDDRLRRIVERVMELMIIGEGDPPRHVAIEDVGALTVHACTPNGGGELNDETGDVHRIIYYDTIWRDYNA